MMENNPWKILSKKLIHETAWMSIEHNDVITPTGNPGVYTTVNFKNWAIGIVVLDEYNNTFLVGQYRFPINEYSWEIPEGGGYKDITALESAKRELLEETGIVASRWDLFYTFNTSNSCTNEVAYLFLARELKFEKANPDETEQLELKKIPFTELVELVLTNKIKDSLTIVGTLLVERFLVSGKI